MLNRVARPRLARIYCSSIQFNTCSRSFGLHSRSFPSSSFIVKNEMPIVRSVTSYCTQPKQEEQQSESQKNIREEVLVDRKIEREPIPTIAAILGGAGLIPVAAGAYGAYFLSASQASLAIYYQMTYSVGILGFLGAVHWGLAMARYSSVAQALQEEGETKKDPSLILRPSPKQEMTQFTLSVVPMLFSWSLQAMPMDIAMPALLVGFTLQFMGDVWADSKGLVPTWYLKLRLPLTTGVLISLGISYLMLGTNKPY